MVRKLALAEFIGTFQGLCRDNLDELDAVYSKELIFIDPIHRIDGLENLKTYFAGLYENLADIRFHVHDSFMNDDFAGIYWTMAFTHSRLNGGEPVEVEGHSRLGFDGNMVCFHQDYFDAAAMIYRQVPLLGGAIRYIDKRLTAR